MIALLCTLEPFRIAWLPKLVGHYRGIGVERFLLTLQLEPDAGSRFSPADLESIALGGPHFVAFG